MTHLVHLTPDEGGAMGWRLECAHPAGEYASCEEDGTPLEPYECYLVSWFDNVGAELLGKGGWPTFTMAVKVADRSHHWGEPTLEFDPTGVTQLVMAPEIAEDSWLHDDDHVGARTFREVVYPYLTTQTRCIEVLATTRPEAVFHLWRAAERAARRADGGAP